MMRHIKAYLKASLFFLFRGFSFVAPCLLNEDDNKTVTIQNQNHVAPSTKTSTEDFWSGFVNRNNFFDEYRYVLFYMTVTNYC